MTSICLYFEVHQPIRLNRFSVFNIGNDNSASSYFNRQLNQEIFVKVAKKCYLPTNNLLLDLIHEFDGKFRISFSITGTFVEYCERFVPAVLDSFKELHKTGAVDLIEETYFHSLSSLFDSLDEFEDQVKMHNQMIKRIFGYKPKVFRNTEAIYDNRIGKKIEELSETIDQIITIIPIGEVSSFILKHIKKTLERTFNFTIKIFDFQHSNLSDLYPSNPDHEYQNDLVINCTISEPSDAAGVNSVVLWYKIDGGNYNNRAMNLQSGLLWMWPRTYIMKRTGYR